MGENNSVLMAKANKLYADAKSCYDTKKYDLGATYYREASIMYGMAGDKTNSALAAYGEFSCYYYDNKFESAVSIGRKICKTMLSDLPSNYLDSILIMHAYSLYTMGEREESSRVYGKIIELHAGGEPSQWYAYAHRGIAVNYAADGMADKAKEEFAIASSMYKQLGMDNDAKYCDDRILDYERREHFEEDLVREEAKTEDSTSRKRKKCAGEEDFYANGVKCYEDAFRLYGENGDIGEARDTLIKMADETEKLGNYYFREDTSTFNTQDYDKYITIYTKARVLYTMLKDRSAAKKCADALGVILVDKLIFFLDNNASEVDKALKVATEIRDTLYSIDISADMISKVNDLIALVCYNKGEELYGMGMYAKAAEYYLKARNYYIMSNNIDGLASALARIIMTLKLAGKIGRAKKIAAAARMLIGDTKNPLLIESISQIDN